MNQDNSIRKEKKQQNVKPHIYIFLYYYASLPNQKYFLKYSFKLYIHNSTVT